MGSYGFVSVLTVNKSRHLLVFLSEGKMEFFVHCVKEHHSNKCVLFQTFLILTETEVCLILALFIFASW